MTHDCYLHDITNIYLSITTTCCLDLGIDICLSMDVVRCIDHNFVLYLRMYVRKFSAIICNLLLQMRWFMFYERTFVTFWHKQYYMQWIYVVIYMECVVWTYKICFQNTLTSLYNAYCNFNSAIQVFWPFSNSDKDNKC